MADKDVLGRAGEDRAARYLADAGYRLIERNWRCAQGELDIVAVRGVEVVIVEVKTRRTTNFGTPAEAVTPRKADKLRELALWWLREHPGGGLGLRFDVVAILVPRNGSTELSHLRGVL